MAPRRQPMPPIVVDKREQRPWTFDSDLVRELCGGALPTVRGTLRTGDYSVHGVEPLVAIERKSLADFVQSVTKERTRFIAEMKRMRAYPVRAVIIEAAENEAEIGAYRSQATPQSIICSALAIEADFQIPVIWAADRRDAEFRAAWMLRRAWGHATSPEAASSRRRRHAGAVREAERRARAISALRGGFSR